MEENQPGLFRYWPTSPGSVCLVSVVPPDFHGIIAAVTIQKTGLGPTG